MLRMRLQRERIHRYWKKLPRFSTNGIQYKYSFCDRIMRRQNVSEKLITIGMIEDAVEEEDFPQQNTF